MSVKEGKESSRIFGKSSGFTEKSSRFPMISIRNSKISSRFQ
ncbi:hypothetical protein [Rossellomorea sp. NPDC077527]